MKKRPLDYRNDIKKYEKILYKNLDNEECMANDLLNQEEFKWIMINC